MSSIPEEQSVPTPSEATGSEELDHRLRNAVVDAESRALLVFMVVAGSNSKEGINKELETKLRDAFYGYINADWDFIVHRCRQAALNPEEFNAFEEIGDSGEGAAAIRRGPGRTRDSRPPIDVLSRAWRDAYAENLAEAKKLNKKKVREPSIPDQVAKVRRLGYPTNETYHSADIKWLKSVGVQWPPADEQ